MESTTQASGCRSALVPQSELVVHCSPPSHPFSCRFHWSPAFFKVNFSITSQNPIRFRYSDLTRFVIDSYPTAPIVVSLCNTIIRQDPQLFALYSVTCSLSLALQCGLTPATHAYSLIHDIPPHEFFVYFLQILYKLRLIKGCLLTNTLWSISQLNHHRLT